MNDTTEPVLIVSPDAEQYLPFLQDLVDAGTRIKVTGTAEAARKAWSDEHIILGQPDLVAEALPGMPGVRWVQSSWAGVTPLIRAGRTDYLLTGVKDTFGPQMAEYVIGYLLGRELRVFERLGRQANRSWWDEPSGSLQGKAVGIMGTGSIGGYIAHSLQPFGVHITGYNRTGAPVAGFDKVCSQEQLAGFLAGLDYLVCVLPDTPRTRHLLDEDAFRQMKNECVLLNIGRGSVVDEAALVKALFAGELAGAVLDVFEQEPLPDASPLWNAPGMIVTGHIAARSWPRDIARIFMENYYRYCNGEALRYRIDFERGY